ncbi:MFS transporter [Desulfobulbus rhabdoformis]|nr:MFS transporter [Desulfobulbus rhabdoformis]MBM9613436.1 MFS transporter [Desulfobulbus rhabdoformis]
MSICQMSNIRRFIFFRVLFNARFYYPVFTILFLDYGLSLEQFALLNTVWAVTIVLAEVPSGALADLLGRKQLLVMTSMLMVLEMALIAFVPLGYPGWIFAAFLANRVISGLAEAMASGADEALAYDTLAALGLEKQWPRVLEVQMKAQNLGYIFAMTLGAAVYDPGLVSRIWGWFGGGEVPQELTMRFPLFLTLIFACLALLTTLQLEEPETGRVQESRIGVWGLTRQTLHAGRWIVHTPLALAVILFGMTFDHTLRMIVTLTSKYYRLIGLPEASFGLLGSLVAVVGLFVPQLARWMSERFSPGKNVLILSLTMIATLFFLGLFIPYLGIVPMVVVFVGLMLTSFFTSHYLNELAASHQRATVLSFKGMAFNAAYGGIGVFFAGLVQHFRAEQASAHSDWGEGGLEDMAFKASMGCLPWYLIIGLVIVSGICWWQIKRPRKAA